jgi:hypothetical protein
MDFVAACAFIAALAAILDGLEKLGINVRIFGRSKMSTPGEVSASKRSAWTAIGLAVLSLIGTSYLWYSLHDVYKRNPYAKFQSARNMQGAMTLYGGVRFIEGHGETFIHVDGDAIIS